MSSLFRQTRNAAVVASVAGLLLTACTAPMVKTSAQGVSELPKQPWEGGPQYWEQFPDAAAYGWSDPGYFPIALWWGVFEDDAEVKWDKDHGINTYIVTNPESPTAYPLMEKHGMSWIGGPLPGMNRDSPAWVGDFLDDEVDGRFPPSEGQAELESIAGGLPDHQKFRYANYTNQVISWMDQPNAEKYVNAYTDAVSIDMYWYTASFCDHDPFQGSVFLAPIEQKTCRTASSYGQTVVGLQERDATDQHLQALWNFVELVPIDGGYSLNPLQVKGAVMASLIAGARGIVWFNNSFGGECETGNAIRTAQYAPDWACSPNVEAMKQINSFTQQLAPVLNTQSYEWNFGPGLRTMLKLVEDDAYVFAMTDGTTGTRSLQLPEGVTAATAEVVGEGRTITIDGGKITDDFAEESTFHVYRIGP